MSDPKEQAMQNRIKLATVAKEIAEEYEKKGLQVPEVVELLTMAYEKIAGSLE